MKKILLITVSLFVSVLSFAQQLQWISEINNQDKTEVIALKEDANHDLYFATRTDSSIYSISTKLSKLDQQRQELWNITLNGFQIGISDIEINSHNNIVVTGYFTDTLTIGTTLLGTNNGIANAFFFEADAQGNILWAKDFNPTTSDFKPYDMTLDNNDRIYITAKVSHGVSLCSFHLLDANANIIRTVYSDNNHVKFFSHILADSVGNVYVSGTSEENASYGGMITPIQDFYQNFLFSFDSLDHVRWVKAKAYVTFDNNNSLDYDGHDLRWTYTETTGNLDTVRLTKVDLTGNIILDAVGPLADAFYPAHHAIINPDGNTLLIMEAYTRIYAYVLDDQFNITWHDTINSHTSGNPFLAIPFLSDNSFYIGSKFTNTNVSTGSDSVVNSNWNPVHGSSTFIAKWNVSATTSINEAATDNLIIGPNPADNYLNILNNSAKIKDFYLTDALGRVLLYKRMTKENVKLDLSGLENGIYFIHSDNSKPERLIISR